jgi:hypothetical protein
VRSLRGGRLFQPPPPLADQAVLFLWRLASMQTDALAGQRLACHPCRGRPRAIRVGDYIHSAKPEAFFTELVELLVREPYVEMFARRRRAGWTSFGNQLPRRNHA